MTGRQRDARATKEEAEAEAEVGEHDGPLARLVPEASTEISDYRRFGGSWGSRVFGFGRPVFDG